VLTLSLLLSYIHVYIYGALCKAINFNVVYTWPYVSHCSFYFLHNVSTVNQCRKLSCGTVVCKHFASYLDSPNYRWDVNLSILMSYIYMELLVKPEILTSYIYGPTFCNAGSRLFIFSAQHFNIELMQNVILCHSCV
jgi:hypothetical protein